MTLNAAIDQIKIEMDGIIKFSRSSSFSDEERQMKKEGVAQGLAYKRCLEILSGVYDQG